MSQTPQPPKEKKLLDQYRDAIRLKHYSYRTEETYISRVREFILFHNKRHPKEMGTPEINQYLTYLVTEKQVSASTHTAPAVGAGGIRHSVPSYFSTVMSYISSWQSPNLINRVLKNQKPSRLFYPKPRRVP